jgi:hypothetical protein
LLLPTDAKANISAAHQSVRIRSTCGSSIQLVEVEAAFKNLKDDLQLRPICHQLEHRIEAHRDFVPLSAVARVERKRNPGSPMMRRRRPRVSLALNPGYEAPAL